MATRKTPSKSTGATAAKSPAKSVGKPASKQASKAGTSVAAVPRQPAAPAARPPRAAAAAAADVAITPGKDLTRRGEQPAETPVGEARYRWIAHAAYLRAEKRGFAPGKEVEDWLAAEVEFIAAHGLSKKS